MNNIEKKELINYDLERILSRVEKEFGSIPRGMEEIFNPQLDYIEHGIYDVYEHIPISDYDLQKVIQIIIYDLKSYIDKKQYDYTKLVDKKIIEYAKELEYLFNPFLNNDIKVTKEGLDNLKDLFTLPIICLDRIYYSIDFWRNRYGKDGYFKMLKEMVVPIRKIGEYIYALDEQYLIN